MTSLDQQPVIIGSGISGLMVSFMLSRADIPHVLIAGERPSETEPRLGESCNLHAAMAMREYFYDDAPDLFTEKRFATIYLTDKVFNCDFDYTNKGYRRLAFRGMGYDAPDGLIHIDRARFDGYLYDRVTSDSHVTVIKDRVEKVEFDRASDAVGALHLADGSTITPRFVFDGTFRSRMVGQAADLTVNNLGKPHRVVYTQFLTADGEKHTHYPNDTWERATSMMGIYKELEDYHMIAWCVPLQYRASVGFSVESDNDASDEELLHYIEAAFARRGVCFRERYPVQGEIKSVTNQYFFHDRAYGNNWMLIGPAYGNALWTTASGVASAVAAGEFAASVLDNPQENGAAYQNYMQELIPSHNVHSWFVTTQPDEITMEQIKFQTSQIILSDFIRFTLGDKVRNRFFTRMLTPLLHRFRGRNNPFSRTCTTIQVPQYEQQADKIFALYN